jgi:hypothetical protein
MPVAQASAPCGRGETGMGLMEGADIFQVGKNCRTSVEMIETYYASHIKNTLGAAAIRVKKPRVTVTVKTRKAEKSAE